MISNRNKLCTGLLGLLMMAGCGSSTDSADSHTPKATGAQDQPAQAAGESQAQVATKAPAAVGSADISAELLAAILTHGSTGNGKVDIFRAFPAYPWNGPGPQGSMREDAAGQIPQLHGGQDLFPLQGSRPVYRFRMGSWYGHDSSVPAFAFASLDTELQVTMPSGAYWPQTLGSQHSGYRTNVPAGETLLTLGTTATTRTHQGSYDPAAQPADQRELRSEGDYLLKAGERVPLDQALRTWRDDQGNTVELLLLAGAQSDQIRLCMNQHVPDVKRLHCTIWQVPADWTYGNWLTYKGIYVVDDRSTRPGDSGHLFWQSTDRAQQFSAAPVSSEGVRSDFLAAVLSTVVPTYDSSGNLYPLWSAAPWDSASPGGSAIPNSTIADVDGWSSAVLPEAADGRLSHSFRSFMSALPPGSTQQVVDFDDASVNLPFSPLAGRYYAPSWQPEAQDDPQEGTFVPGEYLFTANGLPAIGAELLRLDTTANARLYRGQETGSARPSTDVALSLSGDALVLRHGEVVPMHRVLQHWHNGEHMVQLMLLDSNQSDQFRLCLNQHLPRVKRLTCSTWQVPANWQLDQAKPVFKGIQVVDDRSTVGEQGHLYWQTAPSQAQKLKSLKVKALKRSAVQ